MSDRYAERRGEYAVPPRRVAGVALLLAVALAGCGAGPRVVPLDCRVVGADEATPPRAADTLEVRVVLDRLPVRGRLMVRVDPLDQPGAVAFQPGVPPTSAAVSATLTPDAVFFGCFGPNPSGFELAATEAPVGRVWVRVSSDRPVRATVLHPTDLGAERSRSSSVASSDGDAPGATEGRELDGVAEIVAVPGASAEASWGRPEERP